MMESFIDLPNGSRYRGVFQHIINEMKSCSPLFEDLLNKSSKLHSSLRVTIQAFGSFLDSFQRIADSASASRGPSKEIGISLTRICLRQKHFESKLNILSKSILDDLITPLHERLEEWKKGTVILDKKRAKEYKRNRGEYKKRASEVMKIQKKLRKPMSMSGTGTLSRSHSKTDYSYSSAMRDLNELYEAQLKDAFQKKYILDSGEQQALRTAWNEEGKRFCTFVSFYKNVVSKELDLLSELTHVQEAMKKLEDSTSDPQSLAQLTEQAIQDLEKNDGDERWGFESPPTSPSSMGSRKSSMCSISSVNSSSSGSVRSPSHRTAARKFSEMQSNHFSSDRSHPESSVESSSASTPSFSHAKNNGIRNQSSWPNVEESMQFEKAASAILNEKSTSNFARTIYQSASEIYGIFGGRSSRNDSKPPVPKRCSSLERSQLSLSSDASNIYSSNAPRTLPLKKSSKHKKSKEKMEKGRQVPSNNVSPTLPDFNESAPDMVVPQPVYVNMHELNQMKAAKCYKENNEHELPLPSPPPELIAPGVHQVELNCKSQGSLASSGYGSQNQIVIYEDHHEIVAATEYEGCRIRQLSESSSENSRRSSVSSQCQNKPPPPIRRNSSISASPSRGSPVYASPPQLPIRKATNHVQSEQILEQQETISFQQQNQNFYSVNSLSTASSTIGDHSSHGSNDSMDATPHASLERFPPPPPHLISRSPDQRSMSVDESAFKRMSVAETIKTLTEKNHQPVSPNMLRRAHSMKQTQEEMNQLPAANTAKKPIRREHDHTNKGRPTLRQVFTHKMSHNAPGANQPSLRNSYQAQQPVMTSGHHANSPSSPQSTAQPIYETVNSNHNHVTSINNGGNIRQASRRFSEELLKSTATFVQNHVLGSRNSQPALSSKEVFVQTLNAKLSQMRQSPGPGEKNSLVYSQMAHSRLANHSHSFHGNVNNSKKNPVQRINSEMSPALRVRQWISSKTVADPNACRDSLMDQIRKGKKLRETRVLNDRSAPRIR